MTRIFAVWVFVHATIIAITAWVSMLVTPLLFNRAPGYLHFLPPALVAMVVVRGSGALVRWVRRRRRAAAS